jgi:polyisoprenoid-binding protein YceI
MKTLSRIGIPTGTWKVDKAHTRVGFAVKSMGVATVRGEFRQFDGGLEIFDELTDSGAYGRVDAASVDTNQARRDEHLRSKDFLSVESHPELTFRSKAIGPVDGVTNEVQLTAELGGVETGPEGEERIGLAVTGEVSRKAFAMTFAGALGSAVVADTVRIVIDVAAVKEDEGGNR